jgi:predicted amidophosphoribosyltransferase
MAGLERVDVMAPMWMPDRAERTRIGRLIEAAKDRGDDAAVALLAQEAGDWARDLPHGNAVTVVPVPPSPDRPNRLVPAVALALADAWDAPMAELVERHAATQRLREVDPSLRAEVAVAGDYRLAGPVEGAAIVLVDDVVLTHTTLEHVATILRAGGAAAVSAAVLARSRRV